MAMVVYWRFEIGLRAFLNGGGDFLHLFIAGAGAEHLPAGDEAVHDGKQPQPNSNYHEIHEALPLLETCILRNPPRISGLEVAGSLKRAAAAKQA